MSPDGYIGFNYEHSAAEGPPIVHLADACYTNLLSIRVPYFSIIGCSVNGRN